MKLILIVLTVLLTGCANKLAFVGDHFDRGDPCQITEFSRHTGARLKPEGYVPPSACNSASRTTQAVIRNMNGSQVGTITNR